MQTKHSVLISGCSSGIGLATAQTLRQRGWNVIASTRQNKDMVRLKEMGFTAVRLNIADPQSIADALDETLTLTGGVLHALVNNAAIAIPGAVEDLSREILQRQFDTNFFGTMELTNIVLALMRRQGHGRIIMVSSILGRVAMPWRGAYNASKFALEAITDTLRMELRDTDIKVSLICPGAVKSRFRDNSLANFDEYVDADSSPHRNTYTRLRAQTGEIKNNTPFTVPPEAVAKRIAHALESAHPKARYYVTLPAYVLAFLRCVLPTHWMDALLARI
ncbi:MAG: SDR family NAD(P)-dependent oxidoreductase [Gammaproteobacteria bacterium]|nr:SDR family NAD(P)-dependent oxidoreductase [Gammaproteobacteria bacterium]MBU6509893.1 SDR family NAD(P)-dependent oxidoreductase [Gammaproteobacteria bacterium]MDE1984292.1 SDR family NAD(P)-dependent oxidoreductase [Gammaproteobacteria bacterium]MDE2109388.1 SDR family NAD(P)-dependent oxidoreductase [Gammaproteobacteria bacterium]